MSLQCGGYVGASGCSAGPRPGALALMSWFLGAYGSAGGTNLGIFACRKIAGTNTWSVHAEGRACDLGVPVAVTSWTWNLANWLVNNSRELGVQLVIYRNKVWSATRCDEGWRDYGGIAHDNHEHVELTPAAAESLTVARINAIASGPTWQEKVIDMLPMIKAGDRGAAVRQAQSLLAAASFPPAKSFNTKHVPDGIFGAGVTAAAKAFQKAQGLKVDGVIGPASWTALLKS